jgi:hypothetical protein
MNTTPHNLPQNLAHAAAWFGVARRAVEAEVAEALVASTVLHPAGIAEMDARVLRALPFETLWRVLMRVVTTISGEATPPRYESILPLAQALAAGTLTRRVLSGVMVAASTSPKTPHAIMVMREPRAWAAAAAIASGETLLWDKRFCVSNHTGARLRIAPLNARMSELKPSLFARRSGGVVIPAVFHLEECVAAPHIGMMHENITIDFIPAKPLADPAFITRVFPSQHM